MLSMMTVFNDPLVQKEFERKGYVLFPGLLAGSGLNDLKLLFEKHQHQFKGSFHASHFSTDTFYKREVHDVVSHIVFKSIQLHLHNYVPVFGNFMIKNPDPETAMDLHADWTYVDETKYTSIAVWIPLVDVDADNGCLGVIEGSQNITNIIRGPLIQQSSRTHEKDWEANFGKLLKFKAGDAIVYNHRLLHYSRPNKSASARPAINLSLVPESATVVHYCSLQPGAEIQMHKVENIDFFVNYDYLQSPVMGSLINTLPAATIKYLDKPMQRFRFTKYINLIKGAIKI